MIKNPFRNDFTIKKKFKNMVLYEIYSVKSRVANTYELYYTYFINLLLITLLLLQTVLPS